MSNRVCGIYVSALSVPGDFSELLLDAALQKICQEGKAIPGCVTVVCGTQEVFSAARVLRDLRERTDLPTSFAMAIKMLQGPVVEHDLPKDAWMLRSGTAIVVGSWEV